jgi:hypothetical protein
MTNKEKQIILNTYKENYSAHEILKIDKSETLYTLRYLLDSLELKKDRYIIENSVIIERDNIKFMEREAFQMIFDTFLKYGKYIHYDLQEIDMYYDDLQYEMTEEEIRCHNARIRNIMSYRAA